MLSSKRPQRPMTCVLMAIVAAVSSLIISPAALAEVLHIPKQGGPALEVNAPESWSSVYDQSGNLLLVAPDSRTVLVLSLNRVDGASQGDLDLIAAGALKVAKAEPYSAKTPGSIAGHAGWAYASGAMMNGKALKVSLSLAVIDRAHIATLTRLTRSDATPKEKAALETIARAIRLIGP